MQLGNFIDVFLHVSGT